MPAARDESIRGEYERHDGAGAYYRSRGATYRNPHEPEVRESLLRAARDWELDLTHVLDLAAGSGEVTLRLRELGATQIDVIDPFTFDAYRARTGADAERFTFEQIAAGALADRQYSLVVCSFAMHLCELSRLPALCTQLSLIAPSLLILTPHKRPVIQSDLGWELVREQVMHRVRARLYRSRNAPMRR